MYILYVRIKQRRKELGLNQEQLAAKVEYTDHSIISKVESGKVDLPYGMIWKFAEALETTPEWLMGFDLETQYINAGCTPEQAKFRAALARKLGVVDDNAVKFIDQAADIVKRNAD